MKTLRTQIQIRAVPEQVWNVLTDFDHYQDWNPFICRAVGHPERGGDLIVQCQGQGLQPTTLHCEITECIPFHTLAWEWKIGAQWMCSGAQQFTIRSLGSIVLFEQRIMMEGPLLPLFARHLRDSCSDGVRAMDHALKMRVENSVHNHAVLATLTYANA